MRISQAIEVGQAFNPYRQFNGVFIPEAILGLDITPAAKLLYGQLSRYAGRDGNAYPSYSKLAKDLGFTDRHISRVAKELSDERLIEIRRRAENSGRQRSNAFVFLWHKAFDPKAPDVQAEGDIVVGDDIDVGGEDDVDVTPGDDTHVTPLRESQEESHSEEKEQKQQQQSAAPQHGPSPAAVGFPLTLAALKARAFTTCRPGEKWEQSAHGSGFADAELASAINAPEFDTANARTPVLLINRAVDLLAAAARRPGEPEPEAEHDWQGARVRPGHHCGDPTCVEEMHIEAQTAQGEPVKLCAYCNRLKAPDSVNRTHKRCITLRQQGKSWAQIRDELLGNKPVTESAGDVAQRVLAGAA